MSVRHIAIYAIVFIVGYVAARYMPSLGQKVGLP